MQRFFLDNEVIQNGNFTVIGEKYNHIAKSLRMTVGECAVFCDGDGTDYDCELVNIDAKSADFKIIRSYPNTSESDLKIIVYQCLPKGDKMDEMVKRCVQFGVHKIIPVISSRCVSRPDEKSCFKKVERLNKISRSSAMQSMRGCIPVVENVIDFKTAVLQMKNYEKAFICYESEKDLYVDSAVISENEIAFLVGPEGGLDMNEVSFAAENGIPSVSLGRRILRTEDAAAFLIPILLMKTNNL